MRNLIIYWKSVTSETQCWEAIRWCCIYIDNNWHYWIFYVMLLSISILDIISIEIPVSSIDIINWIVDIDSNLDSIFYLYRVSTRQNVYQTECLPDRMSILRYLYGDSVHKLDFLTLNHENMAYRYRHRTPKQVVIYIPLECCGRRDLICQTWISTIILVQFWMLSPAKAHTHTQ